MIEYRRKDLDLSTRIYLGIEMLFPAEVRGWGRASELAREYEISRSLLYQFKDRVQEALEAALKPKQVGRPAEQEVLQIDRDYVRKAITVMPMLTGSVRSIQIGLELLFGVQRLTFFSDALSFFRVVRLFTCSFSAKVDHPCLLGRYLQSELPQAFIQHLIEAFGVFLMLKCAHKDRPHTGSGTLPLDSAVYPLPPLSISN